MFLLGRQIQAFCNCSDPKASPVLQSEVAEDPLDAEQEFVSDNSDCDPPTWMSRAKH